MGLLDRRSAAWQSRPVTAILQNEILGPISTASATNQFDNGCRTPLKPGGQLESKVKVILGTISQARMALNGAPGQLSGVAGAGQPHSKRAADLPPAHRRAGAGLHGGQLPPSWFSRTRIWNATPPSSIWPPNTPTWRPTPTTMRPACWHPGGAGFPQPDHQFLRAGGGPKRPAANLGHRPRAIPAWPTPWPRCTPISEALKGRLGFNNPDGYGTTVSLRTENYRINARRHGG